MKTMKDYHNLKCDALLLDDVFEEFRNKILKKLRIMPKSLFEYTSIKLGCSAQYDKSLTWTYFRHTHVFLFFLEKSVRGGVSYISKR